MIRIDDAGTGCIFGKGVIVGYKEETKEVISFEIDRDITEICMDILTQLNCSKDEEIQVCRGEMFKGFVKLMKNKGYNISAIKIEGEFQDIAENVFIKQLHELGFSTSIMLHGRDYKRLHVELLNDLYYNPHLIKTLRKSSYNLKSVNRVIYVINRLTGEFPNLYSMMLAN